jgi:hypothetical protein
MPNRRENGSGSVRPDGYHIIGRNSRRLRTHILVAESVLGRKLRHGEVVHHLNEDRSDNRPENLLICTHAYHMVIHQRMRALSASGNADHRPCPFCKRHDDLKNLVPIGKGFCHTACRKVDSKRRKDAIRVAVHQPEGASK